MNKDDRYGATDDTYADDATDGYADPTPAASTSVENEATDETASGTATGSESVADSGSESTGSTDDLPFIFARRTVKADREAVPVYLRSETATEVQEVERSMEAAFEGDKVMSLDVREALIQAGLRNVDDVEDVMRNWGYGRR